MSSGPSCPARARLAKSFTALVNPCKLNESAFLITGTIKFPLGSAAAIPKCMPLCIITLSPSTLAFTPGKSPIALTIASASKGVNVSFSPNFSRNLFLFLFLHKTKFVTSASTKEVTCGDVCTESTMCLAISLRIRSISTTSYPPEMDAKEGCTSIEDAEITGDGLEGISFTGI